MCWTQERLPGVAPPVQMHCYVMSHSVTGCMLCNCICQTQTGISGCQEGCLLAWPGHALSALDEVILKPLVSAHLP